MTINSIRSKKIRNILYLAVCLLNIETAQASKKLYVGNLSYSTSSAQLEQMFAQFGTVNSAQVIEDRITGRSKGFGFVEMSSDMEAKAAIEGLNGRVNDGRSLTVNEARPREERSDFGGGGGGYDDKGRRGGRRGGGGGFGAMDSSSNRY